MRTTFDWPLGPTGKAFLAFDCFVSEWSGWHFYLDLESRWSWQRPLARAAFKNSPTDFACVIATSFHCPLLGGAHKGKGQIVPISPTISRPWTAKFDEDHLRAGSVKNGPESGDDGHLLAHRK